MPGYFLNRRITVYCSSCLLHRTFMFKHATSKWQCVVCSLKEETNSTPAIETGKCLTKSPDIVNSSGRNVTPTPTPASSSTTIRTIRPSNTTMRSPIPSTSGMNSSNFQPIRFKTRAMEMEEIDSLKDSDSTTTSEDKSSSSGHFTSDDDNPPYKDNSEAEFFKQFEFY